MKEQIETVKQRDGVEAANQYAKQTLSVYRRSAKDRKHFAHIMPFRPHFVRSMIYLRKYLKEQP